MTSRLFFIAENGSHAQLYREPEISAFMLKMLKMLKMFDIHSL